MLKKQSYKRFCVVLPSSIADRIRSINKRSGMPISRIVLDCIDSEIEEIDDRLCKN